MEEAYERIAAFRNLKRLELAQNILTPQAMEYIATLTRLEYLNLTDCAISVDFLEPLAGLPNLKTLIVKGNPDVSREAVAELLGHKNDESPKSKITKDAAAGNAVKHSESGIMGFLGPWLCLDRSEREAPPPVEQAEPATHGVPRPSPGTRMLDGTTRREFLATAAPGAAVSAATPSIWTPQAMGAEPKPWTIRLSASSINFQHLPVEQACQRIAELGFEAVDIWSAHDGCPHLDDVLDRLGPEGLRSVLAEHKLKLFSFSVYRGGYQRYAELLGEVGGGVAVRGSTGPCEPNELVPRMRDFLKSLQARGRTCREIQFLSRHRKPRQRVARLVGFLQGICRHEPITATGHRVGSVPPASPQRVG